MPTDYRKAMARAIREIRRTQRRAAEGAAEDRKAMFNIAALVEEELADGLKWAARQIRVWHMVERSKV